MRAVFFVLLLLPFIIPVLVDDAFAAEGDITAVKTQSEGNNLEHDTDRGKWNSLVQVDSDTYALAYKGKDKDGFISTFTISSDGTTITKVDTLEHDTVLGEYNSLVQVDSDTYALAYRGAGEDGFISTFTIDSDGNITAVRTQSEGNNLEHDTNAGSFNSLVQVDSDTYALAYAGTGDNGFISTFTIDSDGVITPIRIQDHTNHASASANLLHDNSRGKWNSLVQVDSDTYALAYEGQDRDGFISTFTISSDGTSIVRENTLEHDTNAASFNSLVQVDSDTYALAYTSWDEDGFISTFTIDSDGVITAVKTQSENNNLFLFSIRPATLFYYWKDTSYRGQEEWVGPNPPYGALINFVVNSDADSAKITISRKKKTVREYKVAVNKGKLDQIVWDLKYPPPSFQNNERDTEGLTKPDKSQLLPIPPHGLDPEGPDVSPGTYLVTISAGNDSFSQKVKVNGDPKLDLKAGDYRKRELFLIDLHAFHEKVFVKNNELKETVKEYEKTMDEDDEELKNMKALQKKVNTIRSGAMRLASELQGGGVRQGSFYPPTDTHQQRYGQLIGLWEEIQSSDNE